MTPTRFHQGRLLDRVHLRVADLEASRACFFAADELFVSTGEPTAGLHLAFPVEPA